MSPRLLGVKHSVTPWSLFAIVSALTCPSATRPVDIHPMSSTSLHVISFTRPSPTLVLQATNAEVRWSGYETRVIVVLGVLELLLKEDSKTRR